MQTQKLLPSVLIDLPLHTESHNGHDNIYFLRYKSSYKTLIALRVRQDHWQQYMQGIRFVFQNWIMSFQYRKQRSALRWKWNSFPSQTSCSFSSSLRRARIMDSWGWALHPLTNAAPFKGASLNIPFPVRSGKATSTWPHAEDPTRVWQMWHKATHWPEYSSGIFRAESCASPPQPTPSILSNIQHRIYLWFEKTLTGLSAQRSCGIPYVWALTGILRKR